MSSQSPSFIITIMALFSLPGVISSLWWLTLIVNLLRLECTLQGAGEGVSTGDGCEQCQVADLGLRHNLKEGEGKR